MIRASTHADTLWIARFGPVVDKVPFDQYGLAYDGLVNTIRAEISPSVRILPTVAQRIEPDPLRPRVHLPDGGVLEARLVILASGLNWTLREALGIRRDLVSACHSITVGFDLERTDGQAIAFPGLQYNPERYDQGLAYLTLFRIGAGMRANLFLYQPLRKPLAGTVPCRSRRSPARPDAETGGTDRRLSGGGPGQGSADGSARVARHREVRHRAGRRRFYDALPRYGHRIPQGHHRCGAALQSPHPGLARHTPDVRREDRDVLRGSGEAGL
ncbi:NAD(P)/FAD-dependent oxidoreductase [Methylobacterium gregans]|uniref:NAD(P)/FAD-dependent oxidoreductase n=1 Tax=Methylobacterium gregans TaxID=374424 RepID=UPI001EE34DEB|nr:hypothetical protein [Methylobacterium gregans]